MNEAQGNRPAGPFPILRSVTTAYRNVLRRPHHLLCLATLPLLANLILVVVLFILAHGDTRTVQSYLLVFVLPVSFMGLAWTRHSLWETKPRLLPSRPWLGAYLKMLAYHIPGIFWVLGMLSFSTILSFLLADTFGRAEIAGLSMSGYGLVLLLLTALAVAPLALLFLALPLIGAGLPASPHAAWRLGKGLGLRFLAAAYLMVATHILLAALILFLSIAVAETTFFMEAALHDTFFVRSQIAFLTTALILLPFGSLVAEALFAELMALGYRHRTGRNARQAAILERFE